MSIASKLEYLDGTKDYIRQCIQQKGVTVPANTTFRQYGDKILEIETEQHGPDYGGEGGGGGTGKLTVGTATATGKDHVITPPEDYDGFSAVNVTGDYNLKPENIAEGITIYGVTGTMQVPRNTSIVPPAYADLLEQAKQHYNGEYKNLMILESDSTVAFGFLLDGFNVDNYDPENTEFFASKWVYVAYNKSTGAWKVEPWENTTSNGNSYIKNVRYCDMYVYYGALLIYPMITIGPEFVTDTMSILVKPSTEYSSFRVATMYGSRVIIDWGDGFSTKEYENLSNTNVNHEYDDIDKEYKVTLSGYLTRVEFRQFENLKFVTPVISTLQTIANMFDRYSRTYDYLDSIPPDMFSTLSDNDLIGSIVQFCRYQDNIRSIPDGLFDRLINVTTANIAFAYCKNLSYIPADLFRNMKKLKTAEYIFDGCENLREVPEGLFSECSELTSIRTAFRYNKLLTSIPSMLVSKDPDSPPIDMQECFLGCASIRYIPDDFFHNIGNPKSIARIFSDCSGLQYIPPIWDESIYGTKYTSITHTNCFQNCANASNFKDVPTGWK